MITLKTLLEAAIEEEQNAQQLYRRGADMVDDKETKQFLNRLENEEKEHEKMIFNIKETGLYDLDVQITNDSILDEIKQSHGNDSIAFDKEHSIEDVFEIALKREYQAQRLYTNIRDSVQQEELKKLFQGLADQEADHHRDVEKQFNLLKGIMGPEM